VRTKRAGAKRITIAPELFIKEMPNKKWAVINAKGKILMEMPDERMAKEAAIQEGLKSFYWPKLEAEKMDRKIYQNELIAERQFDDAG
jgi:hypothetical protein